MKEFFHGLRRKAWMVVLGLACVVMGMWIRSNFIVWPAVNRTVLFVSAECKLTWETDYNSEEVAGYPVWNATTFMSVATADEGDEEDTAWRFRYLGFEIGELNLPREGGAISFCCVPYRSLTIPLTLLSAYLILWKPRKRDSGPPQS